jgi:succinoglycan biosynthesis protein ExoA
MATSEDKARSDVIVVIPTYNEERAIEPCLRSLLDGDPLARKARVMVVDGRSEDRTRDIVRDLAENAFPNIRLLDNPDRLQSAAVNRAVARSGLERGIIVRCDGHAVYPRGFVSSVVGALRSREEAASVVSVLDATGSTAFQRAAAFIMDTPFGSGGSAHRGGTGSGWVDHGHHAGFRVEWFKRLGGYDETFSHNEDAEYDHRQRQAGGRIWLDDGLRIDYTVRDTLSAIWRQYRNYGCGRARTFQKHRAPLRLRQLVPAIHTALLGFSILVAPLAPWTLAYPLVYAAFLLGIAIWAAVRLATPSGAWAGAVLAAIHLGWGSGFLQQLVTGSGPRAAREAA